MFGWLFRKKEESDDEKVKQGFERVRKDIEKVGDWIKHLDERDKEIYDLISAVKIDLSTIREELDSVKEAVALVDFEAKHKQVFRKTAVQNKQEGVQTVYESVQTGVQTGNLYDILHNLSANERLIIFTLMNAQDGMKLSYEDLARLLGKERATIRGQLNAIKRKSEGLIQELTEPTGKKRVFVSEEVRNKLLKYAKVRVKGSEKSQKKKGKERLEEEIEQDAREDE